MKNYKPHSADTYRRNNKIHKYPYTPTSPQPHPHHSHSPSPQCPFKMLQIQDKIRYLLYHFSYK